MPLERLPRWALQDAKNRFSEVVNAALDKGPQVVTRRGADAAVVLSFDEYQRLGGRRSRETLAELLQSAPKVPGGLVPARLAEPPRKIVLE
jgi:antitoxin Phd